MWIKIGESLLRASSSRTKNLAGAIPNSSLCLLYREGKNVEGVRWNVNAGVEGVSMCKQQMALVRLT